VELRHLRYFLAVAEHGSVAEAARHLHIVQPALSRQIKDLEDELGTELFNRGARGVELTTVGKHFVSDVKTILADLQMARERVLRIANGQLGALRIGVTPNYSWHPGILRPLHAFKASYPDVSVMLEPALSAKQLDKIADGGLDGGFVAWRDRQDPRFSGCRVLDCKLVLAVPRHSKLADKAALTLVDLKDEPCIWFAREIAPAFYDFLIHQCQLVGFSPRLVQIGGDVATILGLVAAGMGYSIVPDAAQYSCPEEVLLLEAPDLRGAYEVEFVWRLDDTNPGLCQLVRTIRDSSAR